jgi:post-segregation antitoxin (ccd killing protein)
MALNISLSINKDGDWTEHTHMIPMYCHPLGVVTDHERKVTGALVHHAHTGQYLLVKDGVSMTLNGRAVLNGLGESGRPRILSGGKRRNVYLDDETVENAKALSGGDISRGLREAVRIATKVKEGQNHDRKTSSQAERSQGIHFKRLRK